MTQRLSSLADMGVVATLTPTPAGRLRLTFDDVRTVPTLDAITWRRVGLFTHTDFDSTAAQNFDLTREQLAEIGENLLLRLFAQHEMGTQDGNYRAT